MTTDNKYVLVTEIWTDKPKVLADGTVELPVHTKQTWINFSDAHISTMNEIDFHSSHAYHDTREHKLPRSFNLGEEEHASVTRLISKYGTEFIVLESPEDIISELSPKRGRPKKNQSKKSEKSTTTNEKNNNKPQEK